MSGVTRERPHSTLNHLLTPPRRRVRVRHPWGHGDWFYVSETPVLQAYCDDYNACHGAGTHYLEWEFSSAPDERDP